MLLDGEVKLLCICLAMVAASSLPLMADGVGSASKAKEPKKPRIIISVHKDGRLVGVHEDDRPLNEQFVLLNNEAEAIAFIAEVQKRWNDLGEVPYVHLRARGETPYKHIILAIQYAKKAGITDIKYAMVIPPEDPKR